MEKEHTGSKLALLGLNHMFEAKYVVQNGLEYVQVFHFSALQASGHEIWSCTIKYK